MMDKENINRYFYAVLGYISNYSKVLLLIFVYNRFFLDKDLLLWYNIGAIASVFSIFELGIGKTILRDLSIAHSNSIIDFNYQISKYRNLIIFIAISIFIFSFFFFFFYSKYYILFNTHTYVSTLLIYFFYLFSSLLSYFTTIFYYPLFYSLGLIKEAEKLKILSNFIFILFYLILFFLLREMKLIPIWVHLLILVITNILTFLLYHFYINSDYRLKIVKNIATTNIKSDLSKQSIFILNYIAFHLFTNIFILYLSNKLENELAVKIIFSLQFINTLMGISVLYLQVKMKDISVLFSQKNIKSFNKTASSVILVSILLMIIIYIGFSSYYFLFPDIYILNKAKFVSFPFLSLIYLTISIETLAGILSQILLTTFDLKYVYFAFAYSIFFTITYIVLIDKIGIQNFFIFRIFASLILLVLPNIRMLYKSKNYINA